MARVLGELEVQKRAMDKHREEIALMREQVATLEVEKSILTKSNQSLSKSLTRVEEEKKEWHVKNEEAVTFISQVLKEKEALGKEVTNLIEEKLEWSRLKERHEQAIATKSEKVRNLEGQLRAILIDESTIMDLTQHVHSLKSLGETQTIVIESSRGKIERLRAGIWAIESVCPPYQALFKNYELQRDIFYVVYSLRPSQVLEPVEFENLWEEITKDGFEHLLTEIMVRGELKLSDMFKGFQIIADLGVHVFLYYSRLELNLSMKRQLVSKLEAMEPTRQVVLQRWNKVVNTAMTICPLHLLQPWEIEIGRLRQSMGNDNYLQSVMDAASERLAIAKHLDIGPGQYKLKYDQIGNRLMRNLQTIAQPNGRLQVQLQNQVTFFLPPANLVQRALHVTRRPPLTPLAHKFLGNYSALFSFETEVPIPSWKAFEWILEDVGQSRQIST